MHLTQEFKSQNGFSDPIEKQMALLCEDLKELCELIGKYNYDKSCLLKNTVLKEIKLKILLF